MAHFGVYLFPNQFDKEYAFCPILFLEFKFDIPSNSTNFSGPNGNRTRQPKRGVVVVMR